MSKKLKTMSLEPAVEPVAKMSFFKNVKFSSQQVLVFTLVFGIIGGFVIYKSFAATSRYLDINFCNGQYQPLKIVFESTTVDSRIEPWGGLSASQYDNNGMSQDPNQRVSLRNTPTSPNGCPWVSRQEIRSTDGPWSPAASTLDKSSIRSDINQTLNGSFSAGLERWFAYDYYLPLNLTNSQGGTDTFNLTNSFHTLMDLHESTSTSYQTWNVLDLGTVQPTSGNPRYLGTDLSTLGNNNPAGNDHKRIPWLQLTNADGSRVASAYNRWHQLVVGVKLSDQGVVGNSPGWIEIWHNGVNVMSRQLRPTLLPGSSGVWLQAQNYRQHNATFVSGTSSVIYYGGIRAGYTKADVDTSTSPTPPPSPPASVTLNSSINNGATVANGTTWTASLSGATPTSMEFWANGTKLATDTSAPYSTVINLPTGSNQLGLCYTVDSSRTCGGTGGIFATISVTVAPPPPPTPAPTTSLTASPSSVVSGSSSTLTWNSTNATACSASGAWSGSKVTSGTQAVTPTTTSTYSLSCTGTGGTTTSSVTITVTAPPPPPPPPLVTTDTTPPSTPANFKLTSAGKTSVTLAWDTSTDNVAVASYRLYRGTTNIYDGLSFNITNYSLSPGASYSYYVVATDKAGNTSTKSSTICVGKWGWWNNITRSRSWSYC